MATKFTKTIMTTEPAHRRLKAYCRRKDLRVGDVCAKAIAAYLKAQKGTK